MQQLSARLSQHVWNAKHHKNTPVAKWIQKHLSLGDTILIKEIDSCSELEWEALETKYIAQYRETYPDLLNVDAGGKGSISKDKRNIDGMIRSAKAHEKAIVAIALNKPPEIYNSIKEFAEKYKVASTAIGNVLSGRSTICHGFYLVEKAIYEDPNFNILDFINSKNSSLRPAKIYQYDLNGNLIKVYDNMSAAKGFDRNCITKAIQKRFIYKGYIWTKTIEKIDPSMYQIKKRKTQKYVYEYDGNRFNTLIELAEYTKMSVTKLSILINSNQLINNKAIIRTKI